MIEKRSDFVLSCLFLHVALPLAQVSRLETSQGGDRSCNATVVAARKASRQRDTNTAFSPVPPQHLIVFDCALLLPFFLSLFYVFAIYVSFQLAWLACCIVLASAWGHAPRPRYYIQPCFPAEFVWSVRFMARQASCIAASVCRR